MHSGMRGDARAAELAAMGKQSGLTNWQLAGRSLIPVVQGGMGVGISAGGLAGAVAATGALGTVSSVREPLYDRLFTRITMHAPAPIGMGPSSN